MSRHRRALITITIAITLDIIAGILYSQVEHLTDWEGLFWALTTATTVGYGDITPRTTTGHIIAVMVMMTVVPLFAATFTLLTAALTTERVDTEGRRARRRLDHIIRNHPAIPNLLEPEDEEDPHGS